MKSGSFLFVPLVFLSCSNSTVDSHEELCYARISEYHSDREEALKEQPHVYDRIELFGEQIKTTELQGDVISFELDGRTYLFGQDDNWHNCLKIIDKHNERQKSFSDSSDSQIFNPTFFKTEFPGDPTIILIEGAGCGESWGNSVLIETDTYLKCIGYLDLASLDDFSGQEFAQNIADYTQISIRPGTLNFSFTASHVLYYSDDPNRNEQKYAGSQIHYTYASGHLKPTIEEGSLSR